MKINYNRSQEIIEVKVFDSTMRKLEKYRATNQKEYSQMLKSLQEKYGFRPEIQAGEIVSHPMKEDDGFFDF